MTVTYGLRKSLVAQKLRQKKSKRIRALPVPTSPVGDKEIMAPNKTHFQIWLFQKKKPKPNILNMDCKVPDCSKVSPCAVSVQSVCVCTCVRVGRERERGQRSSYSLLQAQFCSPSASSAAAGGCKTLPPAKHAAQICWFCAKDASAKETAPTYFSTLLPQKTEFAHFQNTHSIT